MKRHLHYAEQRDSPSNLTKYCACHVKWLSWLILVTYETSFTSHRAYVSPLGICIEKYNISPSGYLPKFHQVLHLQRKVTLQHQLIIGPATKSDTATSANISLATKSDTATSANTAPTTKSDTATVPNSALATKSDTPASRSIAPATKSEVWVMWLMWLMSVMCELLSSELLWTTVTLLNHYVIELLLDWTVTLLSCYVTELLLG